MSHFTRDFLPQSHSQVSYGSSPFTFIPRDKFQLNSSHPLQLQTQTQKTHSNLSENLDPLYGLVEGLSLPEADAPEATDNVDILLLSLLSFPPSPTSSGNVLATVGKTTFTFGGEATCPAAGLGVTAPLSP